MNTTPIYPYHEAHGSLVEFFGFRMPLYYSSIQREHMAVRERVGLFDVSHMGRILIKGRESLPYLNNLTVNDVSKLKPGRCHYTLLCNDDGGVKDDFILSQLGEESYLLVPNASNRRKDWDWMKNHLEGYNVSLENISDTTAMMAVQGLLAEKVLGGIFPELPKRRFSLLDTSFQGSRCIISRTGYTGEDGFEVILWMGDKGQDPRIALTLWNRLLEGVVEEEGLPCGLGARDTLRLEAGMCLYGNDLTEEIDPYEANIAWVVKLDKGDFIGRDALLERSSHVKRLRMGLTMIDPGIPRKGYEVINEEGRRIGEISSGTYSPLLKKGVAFAFLEIEHAQEGARVYVDIRGRRAEAQIKGFPLYDPQKYGWSRGKGSLT